MTITAAASGAPYIPADRKPYPHKLNRSCALADCVFADATVPAIKAADEKSKPPPELSDYLLEMIPQHFERRVQFFFEQAICCYKTGLTFTAASALTQGKSPSRIKVGEESLQRNAAHSSTIPCLIALDGERQYVFLKDTHAYGLWNATMNMPRYVNNADIRIDGNTETGKLRTETLVLLNKTAKGELTPDQALAPFLESCLKNIRAAFTQANTREQTVLAKYQELCQDFQENPARLLYQLLKGTDTSAPLESRYQQIQNLHLQEFQILQKMDGLRQQILGHRRQPYDFERVFLEKLITSAPENGQKALKKFLHLSPAHLPAIDTRGKKTAKLLEKYALQMQQTAQDVLAPINALDSASQKNQADSS